jgi:hypothetical protein
MTCFVKKPCLTRALLCRYRYLPYFVTCTPLGKPVTYLNENPCLKRMKKTKDHEPHEWNLHTKKLRCYTSTNHDPH